MSVAPVCQTCAALPSPQETLRWIWFAGVASSLSAVCVIVASRAPTSVVTVKVPTGGARSGSV